MIAFFDMDETLISVNSAKLWVQYQWQQGELSTTDVVRTLGYLVGYKLAVVDVERLAIQAAQRLIGRSESELEAEIEAWYTADVRPTLVEAMVRVVEEHREKGHACVLLTASSRYIAHAMSQDLELDDFISTRFRVEAGRFTGHLDGGLCWGMEKAIQGREWALKKGVPLEECWFYTDSYTDLPMLESVGYPVAVNPDLRLARWANRRNIKVIHHNNGA